MAADRHSGGGEFFGQIGSPSRVFADLEKCRLGAVVLQRLEHHRRVSRPRPIVERQSDFLIAQEIILFEMLGSECRATRRIDFNDSREPDRIGIIARSNCLRRQRGERKKPAPPSWCCSERPPPLQRVLLRSEPLPSVLVLFRSWLPLPYFLRP